MSGQKCVRCQKTAYPLESVQVNENRWHKICFKCVTCKVQLNVKTFFYREGGAYCEKCGSARFVRPLHNPPPSFFFTPPPPTVAFPSFFGMLTWQWGKNRTRTRRPPRRWRPRT